MPFIDGSWDLRRPPDGQRLLVTDSATPKTVALVDAAALRTVQTVGHTKTAAFVDVVWLSARATAGGPPVAPARRPDDGD